MEAFYSKRQNSGFIKRYQMLREEYASLRNITNQNISQAKIEVELIEDKNESQYFRFEIIEYIQSNLTGLYKWVHDLLPLRSKLIIETRGDGMIGRIVNIGEVRAIWLRLRPILEREHQSETSMLKLLDSMEALTIDGYKLADVLRYTAPFINIFPPLYNKALLFIPDPKSPGYREIENFIGVKTIPVLTEEYILKEQQNYCTLIEVKGAIDRVAFDQHLVTDFVKTIRGKTNVRTEVGLKYTEKYAVDHFCWPNQCLQMHVLFIPGFLHREEKVIIKDLIAWEKNMYRTAYS